MAKTLVIAEPGCTHEGDFQTMLRLLETAAACGASCFKPQWVSDPDQMLVRRHITPDHPKYAYYRQAYGWLNFPVEWHEQLRDQCHALGMKYACTTFLPKDVSIVAPFVDMFKVSSFDADSQEHVTAHKGLLKDRLLLVSCGMRSDPAPDVWFWLWEEHDQVHFLHCVSAYPAPLFDLNLGMLRASIRTDFSDGPSGGDMESSWYQGYSDHSRHLWAGALAVACGAVIVETHFRLDDCNPENPDYAVAFTPAEFTQYIKNIWDAELMLGDGVKKVQPCEEWALPYRVTS